jgi:hypothetical protein
MIAKAEEAQTKSCAAASAAAAAEKAASAATYAATVAENAASLKMDATRKKQEAAAAAAASEAADAVVNAELENIQNLLTRKRKKGSVADDATENWKIQKAAAKDSILRLVEMKTNVDKLHAMVNRGVHEFLDGLDSAVKADDDYLEKHPDNVTGGASAAGEKLQDALQRVEEMDLEGFRDACEDLADSSINVYGMSGDILQVMKSSRRCTRLCTSTAADLVSVEEEYAASSHVRAEQARTNFARANKAAESAEESAGGAEVDAYVAALNSDDAQERALSASVVAAKIAFAGNAAPSAASLGAAYDALLAAASTDAAAAEADAYTADLNDVAAAGGSDAGGSGAGDDAGDPTNQPTAKVPFNPFKGS